MASREALHARKIQSFPSFALKISQRKPQPSVKIVVLSDVLLDRILSNLTYSELTSVRTVCHWFYHVTGKILNQKLRSLKEKIEREQDREKYQGSRSKILSVLASEIRIIEAHVLDYIEGCMFYFYGGAILDFFDGVLASKNGDDAASHVAHIFRLVDNFLTTFDSVSEPQLLEKSYHMPFSWFGKKLVDILDCYTDIGHTVSVKPLNSGKHFKWTGDYLAGKVNSLLRPPYLANSANGKKKDLDKIVRWLRSHIRWNNILRVINSCGNDGNPIDKRIYLDDNNSGSIVFEKSHPKVDSSQYGCQQLAVKLSLYSHTIFAPSRFKELSAMLENLKATWMTEGESTQSEDDTTSSEPAVPEKYDYEFDVKMEMIYTECGSSVTSCKKTTVQICHVENQCFITSNTSVL